MDRCPNCNNELTGSFCSNCGQKRHEPQDRKVSTFVRNFFEESFSFDSKFLKTLKYLLFRPGFLTFEYIQGRVNSYVTPLKMYLFVSVVSFFISSFTNPDDLNSYEENFEEFGAKNLVENYISNSGTSRELFESKFNNEIQGKQPLYFLLLIVLFSLPLKLIYMETKRLYVEHLVFSMHFFTFLLLMLSVSSLIELILQGLDFIFIFFIPFVYLFFAVKNAYGQKVIISFFETVILFLYFFGLLFFWVIAAFFITLLTV
jgi:hypothetical protein